jgi:hypothetical protein
MAGNKIVENANKKTLSIDSFYYLQIDLERNQVMEMKVACAQSASNCLVDKASVFDQFPHDWPDSQQYPRAFATLFVPACERISVRSKKLVRR